VRGAAYTRTAIRVEQYSTRELGFPRERQGLGFTGTGMVTGKRGLPLSAGLSGSHFYLNLYSINIDIYIRSTVHLYEYMYIHHTL
jgi:hypothetical protein